MLHLIRIVDDVVVSRRRLTDAEGRDYTSMTSDPTWHIVSEAVFEAAPILSTKADDKWSFTPRPPAVNTRVSRFQFSQLFTAAERTAIRAARADGRDVALVDAVESFELLEYVDLADPRVSPYLERLVASEVLAAPRKAQILAGQPPA